LKLEACNLKLETPNTKSETKSLQLAKYNQCNTLYLSLNFKACKKNYEGFSLLPRGSAGSGECPGAAAITTIISFLFSSPRGASSERDAEFPTPHSSDAGVRNSGSRRANRLTRKNSLPVINQSLGSCAVGMSPFGGQVPIYRDRGSSPSQHPAAQADGTQKRKEGCDKQ
jgi:hypothetical protein